MVAGRSSGATFGSTPPWFFTKLRSFWGLDALMTDSITQVECQ